MSQPSQSRQKQPLRPSLDQELTNSRQQLTAINNEIREREDYRQKQEADLEKDLALQAAHKKAEHTKAMDELSKLLSQRKDEYTTLNQSIKELEDHILELNNQQLQVHRELKFNTDKHEQQVVSLTATEQQLEVEITNARVKLDSYMTKITEARNQLGNIKQKITQTEQSYLSRIDILKRREKEAEDQCNEVVAKLQEYSSAYDQLTEKEQTRVADLEERERTLIAKTRKFNEERIEFADRRKRQEQTRQLQ